MAYTIALVVEIDAYGNCRSTDTMPSISNPTASGVSGISGYVPAKGDPNYSGYVGYSGISGIIYNMTLSALVAAGWTILGVVPGSTTPFMAIIAK